MQNSVKHSSTERCYYELISTPQAGPSSSLSLEQTREWFVSAGSTVLMAFAGVKGKGFQSRSCVFGAIRKSKSFTSLKSDPFYFPSCFRSGNNCLKWNCISLHPYRVLPGKCFKLQSGAKPGSSSCELFSTGGLYRQTKQGQAQTLAAVCLSPWCWTISRALAGFWPLRAQAAAGEGQEQFRVSQFWPLSREQLGHGHPSSEVSGVELCERMLCHASCPEGQRNHFLRWNRCSLLVVLGVFWYA